MGKLKPNPVPLKKPTAENFEDIDYDSDDEDFSHEFTDLDPQNQDSFFSGQQIKEVKKS